MIDFEDAASHLTAVWRMVMGEDDGKSQIDASTDGVFRSLSALLLSAPFAALGVIAEDRVAALTPTYGDSIYGRAPLAMLLPLQLIIAAVIWLIMIVALGLITKRLNAGRAAAGLIVSYNWSQLLVYVAAAAPATVLVVTGAVEIVAILYAAIVLLNIFVFWRILRAWLPVNVPVTIALVVGLSGLSIIVYSLLVEAGISAFQAFS